MSNTHQDAFAAGFRTAELRAIRKLEEVAEHHHGGDYLKSQAYRDAAMFLKLNRYNFDNEE